MQTKYTIEDMQKLAKKKKGKCLSKEYSQKMKWQCKEGHDWYASPGHIRDGTWCPKCFGNPIYTIEDMYKLAKKIGWKCISKKYESGVKKLKWECSNGHTINVSRNKIKIGRRCAYCSRKKKKTIKEMKEIAKENEGWCLSKKYRNKNSKLEWKCKKGHKWETPYSNIRDGTWCPICSKGKNERICRWWFKKIFKKKFDSTRDLKWLKNKEGHKLELDGYCPKLKLAFEYQGKQHYKQILYFQDNSRFKKRIRDDELKKKLCKENGVELILMPHFVKGEDMGKEIMKRISRDRKKYVKKYPSNIDFSKCSIYPEERIKIFQKIAKKKKGECLSKSYLGYHSKLKLRCMEGHEWEALPSSIKKGHWCRRCSSSKRGFSQRLGIKIFQKIAKKKKGECLSKEYKNNMSKLKFKCSKGHEWESIPSSIKNTRTWCPYCAGNRKLS